MPDPRSIFMADQLQAEVLEVSKGMMEEALHMVGLCSAEFSSAVAGVVDTALLTGSTATLQVLTRHGRIKAVTE